LCLIVEDVSLAHLGNENKSIHKRTTTTTTTTTTPLEMCVTNNTRFILYINGIMMENI